MPCLDNLLNLPASALADLTSCPEFKPIPAKPSLTRKLNRGNGGGGAIGKSPELESDPEKEFGSLVQPKLRSEASDEDGDGIARALNPCRVVGPTTAKLVQEWSKRKIEEGIPEFKCSLPFLVGAPKSVQCGVCQNVVYPEEKIFCSVRGCRVCSLKKAYISDIYFVQACFLCKQKNHLWRCIRCPIACHEKCAPFPENVIHFPDRPGEAICWKHPTDWRSTNISANPIGSQGAPPAPMELLSFKAFLFCIELPMEVSIAGAEILTYGSDYVAWGGSRSPNRIDISLFSMQHELPANNLEDIFALLPLPYNEEEFKIDINWKDQTETKLEPHPYIPIKRILLNALMVVYAVHQLLKSLSLLQNLHKSTLSESEKDPDCKEHCGWGVVAGESISKGDFIVEYVGEVINDAMCERRLWDMKDQDAKNFYMCEINKDFVIDATFKGNASWFLNHSCAPNCKLEKWQVEGEIRVGVFASRSIEVGEALTYDYRYLELEGDINRRAS
ncbi:hypothetical protein DH2020_030641 [Rehmannia glutinosa]|uniref:SET domain-containing protein n=1 Tax=Rehmannia glutinosa TaxID=99300 RepID=A0ABR0VMQ9_REHGL